MTAVLLVVAFSGWFSWVHLSRAAYGSGEAALGDMVAGIVAAVVCFCGALIAAALYVLT